MKKQALHRVPVCGKRVNRQKAHVAIEREGYVYCSPRCQQEFERDPAKYARKDLGHKVHKP